MPKRHANKRAIATVALVVIIVGALAATAVAQSQRFPDVPPTHEAYEAVEWAAEVGLTVGREDGTFGPNEALPKWRALIFMERFYDDVLGADESGAFTSGDMMVLLKAINDGASAPAAIPEPELAADALPTPGRAVADGRCAPAITMGIYDWEACAWNGVDDPSMSRSDMEAMVRSVWSEVDGDHKPSAAPALTEGHCGLHVLGCYLGSTHTVQLDTGFTLRTLLHELAHALTADAYSHCADDWTHTRPNCAHDGVFRCAADALYRRYADMDAAGVCGADPVAAPGQWILDYTGEVSWGTIHANAGMSDGGYWFGVRCFTRLGETPIRDVLIVGPRDISRIRYRLSGGTSLVDLPLWNESDVVFMDGSPDTLIEGLEASDKLWLWVEHTDGGQAQLSFDLGDSPALDIVNAWCD